jgi:Uncharacterized conserved protein
MGNSTLTLFVEGMTCSSCEARIERALLSIPGVLRAKANQQGGEVVFEYDEGLASPDAAKAAIEKAGYTVKDKRNASTLIALGIGLVLAAAYMIASSVRLFDALPKIDASIGYGMLFVVGLLTSVHCVAMCGGISLSQSIKATSSNPAESAPVTAQLQSTLARLSPGLLYNGGRVISYTIIGGIVGALGSAFNFSPTVKGAIAGAAGLFMLYLGLKMLGLVPALPKVSHFLPAGLGKRLERAQRSAAGRPARIRGPSSPKAPFAVGLLNGLMPCGPLQTMQLYALGTGSFFAGALSMFIFSIGTVPLMLTFGIAATVLPRRLLPVMVKASAVLVMFLGVVTFSRAASLAGIALPNFGSNGGVALASVGPVSVSDGIVGATTVARDVAVASKRSSGIVAKLEGGVQTVTTELKDGYYVPFTVQAGVPVKWTIRVTQAELNGCNNPVTIPAYGIQKTLVAGDNLVEFTPKNTGTIAYTCWMGMISSHINVVKDIAGSATADIPPGTADGSVATVPDGSQGTAGQGSGLQGLLGGGASCCSGTSTPAFAGGRVPADTIGMPVVKDGVQEITITVDNRGYTPAAIVLQKGMKAVIKFKASQLSSCNNVVMFPEYNGGLDLSKGQLETPALTISQDFTFQCWMGMLHGYVKTVDDLAKVDVKKVKAEVAAYRASSSSGGAGGCCGR